MTSLYIDLSIPRSDETTYRIWQTLWVKSDSGDLFQNGLQTPQEANAFG